MRRHSAKASASRKRQLSARTISKVQPVSSHPEIEEEIEHADGGLDPTRIRTDEPRALPKPIVSVHGRDVEDLGARKTRRAA